jgi:hypothetical protein
MADGPRNRDQDPYRYRDDERTARVASDQGYIGAGNYWSGEFSGARQNDYDYDYADYTGEVGIDEYGDQEYGGGRYGPGPFEQSQQYGGDGVSAGRGPLGPRLLHERRSNELSGPSDWSSAPDYADPYGYRVFHAGQQMQQPARSLRRGPKGYRRSDERTLEDIYLHLLQVRNLDSSDVSIEVHNGVATLTGTVPVRRMKHMIEDLVHSIRGIEEVDNRIRVQSRPGDQY